MIILQVTCMIVSCLLQSKLHLASSLHDNDIILPSAEHKDTLQADFLWFTSNLLIVLLLMEILMTIASILNDI